MEWKGGDRKTKDTRTQCGLWLVAVSFLKMLTMGESGCGAHGNFISCSRFSVNVTCPKKWFINIKPVGTRQSETERYTSCSTGVRSAPGPERASPSQGPGHRDGRLWTEKSRALLGTLGSGGPESSQDGRGDYTHSFSPLSFSV